ncbi:ABC transporter substrate-binding protein [Saccharothrix yanglingensis]|uniref:ABC transporter substrate-binding protein n=1 Tax=Saccharothrix yanglingensis TaxID=659496 RepID=A0ABU0X9D1_9PSEU|nr:ABC transporter substrate-binding protein [Saccharothrix yanglingensis]MDQ2588730.1 ABC transporter substrate-binding protein [Saccharothrix yanglingensis]
MPVPLIGVVLASTGRLAPLGVPLDFAARALPWPVDVLVRDSASTADGARAAVASLAEAGARLVVTLGGTETLPAVATACVEREVPCVSTTLPWQVFAARVPDAGWAFHFGWGLDDIAEVFADLWERVGPVRVGCLWNDGAQGRALRRWFRPVAEARGHELVDLPYREAWRLPDVTGLEVVTSAATAADLAAALHRARPRLVTCSRWLTYPFAVARHHVLDRVATVVSWTPERAGGTGRDLAAAYETATGSPWSQPLGLAHALMEVACHAATGSTSRAGAAAVLSGARVPTVAGVLDWAGGPVPGVARIPLAGGQWRAGDRPELVVVDNRRAPALPVGGDLLLGPHPAGGLGLSR